VEMKGGLQESLERRPEHLRADERQRRRDAALFEPRAGTGPVAEQVLPRQDELERRFGKGASAGRSRLRLRLRGVLGMGGGDRPAEEHQTDDEDATSAYGHVH